MASLHSPPLYSSKRVMGLPTLPFTTVQDDLDIAPAPKLPEELLISVQTGTGHYKDEHVPEPDLPAHVFSRALAGLPVIFRGLCVNGETPPVF